ncbi:MAG TPA: hypothetical protein VEB64_10300 [Azospirillaceae bacterium]|nr:hypothetical protein [Azospirillaceae bacterium]
MSYGRSAPHRRRARGRRTTKGFWTFVFLAAPVALVFHATAIVLVVGMVPTAVAYFIDRTEAKLAPITVGSLNICGVLPFLLDLWFKKHSLAGAFSIIGSPVAWLVMYAAAGLGWAIFYGVPPAVVNFHVMRAEARMDALRKAQSELVQEWGTEVAGDEHEEMLVAGAAHPEKDAKRSEATA